VNWTVWVRDGQRRLRFHTVDVSARGAKLRPKGPFQPGTPIQLQVIKPYGQRLRVSGVVWRVDPDGVAVLFLGSVPEGFDALPERRPA
jgi:hypothetical protein